MNTYNHSTALISSIHRLLQKFLTLLAMIVSIGYSLPQAQAQSSPFRRVKTVWVIVMENKDWSSVKDNKYAPYINKTLLPIAAHAENYHTTTKGIHPSLPNYLYLEAGTGFGIDKDLSPKSAHQATHAHLVNLLESAGVSWRAYQEGIPGNTCPLTDGNGYAAKHDPFVYFDDVTNNNDVDSVRCISHIRPYSELAADLANNAVADYNFITPDLCNDTHDCGLSAGDRWLSREVPKIMQSAAYKAGGAIFITWDEGGSGNHPIGMLVLSPFVKKGYENNLFYTHGSTLRTMQEIFGVTTPLLGGAAQATDLRDFFATSPGRKTITLPPFEDAYVRDGIYAEGHFGNYFGLRVKHNSDPNLERESYLKFDLGAVPGPITSARLRLYGSMSSSRDVQVRTDFFSVPDLSWSEDEITWNTKPAARATPIASVTVSGREGSWYEVDLTSFLQREQALGRSSTSLALRNPTESTSFTRFNAKESPENHPQLMIEVK